MNDSSLSLLSRGCGRFVSSNGSSWKHNGRLEVCYTPQDYYIWKSQESLLRLSASGRLLVKAESTLPKTYSTRKGPLLLYSQDLVTLENSCGSEAGNRKKRVVPPSSEQVEQQLNTIKELTAAILSCSNNQNTPPRLSPPLHFPPAPALRCPSPLSIRPTKAQPLCFKNNAEQVENKHKGEGEEPSSRDRVRLDLFLQTTESPEHTEMHHHSTGGTHPDKKCVHEVADDRGRAIQNSNMTNDDKSSISGRKGLLLPPLCGGPCWERTDRLRCERVDSGQHRAQHLPPIHTAAPAGLIQDQEQDQQDAQPRTDRDGFQSEDGQRRLHQQPLTLPLMFPEKEEALNGMKRRGGRGRTERTAGWDGGGGRGKQHTEKPSGILQDSGPGQLPPTGMLGRVAGWKGPGKQSSLAFLQSRLLDLQDPRESSHATRSVVKGVLPLELRDLQNGSLAGCLILGPDGEIVQLSLYNITQNPPLGEEGTGQQALQVLSTEGDTLPWVVVLQPEHTHTEGGVELNADDSVGDTEHQQHTHELFDSKVCSPISITDAAAVTQKKTKSTAATMEIQKKTKKDVKNNVGMPPLRELVEELTGGNTQEEEELTTAGQHQPSHRAGEATTEEVGNRRTTSMKRKDAEEAAIRRGKTKNVTSTESDGQKTSRRSKEGRRQRQKGEPNEQPIRRQKQEERTNRDQAAGLPSQKKKRRDVEGERGKEKTKEERKESRKEEESPERTRRRKKRRVGPKHKELIVGNDEEEKEEIHQEMEEESQLESSKSTTQTHNNKTKTHSEEDMNVDRLSTTAYLSGVRSEAPLRSSKAAFNRSSSNRSSCEGAKPTSTIGHSSTHGRLSSCSTVMVTEEQLVLNPVKPESSALMRRQKQEEATALHLAERAERRRQEVERKRREREEQEKEQMEERMKSELEEERRKRAEQLRLKKLEEEEERKRRAEVEEEQAKREEAQREREKRRQEERRRQMERLQRMREEEEQRRKAELERFQLEEQRRQDEERKKMQEMDDKERTEYLQRKEEEEEERREEEAAILAAEEARLQAELLAREMALLQQQQLAFQRGLAVEAGGLERTQAISRPWTFSYFPPLHLLGLSRSKAETTT